MAGQLAAELRQFGIAAACAERSILSPLLPTRVRAQLVREAIRIGRLDVPSELGAAESSVYTKRMVATCIESLRLLEEAVLSAQRCDDAALLTETAVAVHQVALPLLHPEFSKLVHRPLALAAAALEAVDSPLSELRAQLHAELARCELRSQYLHKARAQLAKCLALDVADEAAQQRLDRVLRPLAERLTLRAEVWSEPEGLEQRAVLRLERALGTVDSKLRKAALTEAVALLDEAPLLKEGDADASRERALLWSELLGACWKDRLSALTRRCAMRLLAWPVDAASEARVGRAQAEAHFALAETKVLSLARRGRAPCVRPAPPHVSDAPPRAERAMREGGAEGASAAEAKAEAEAAAREAGEKAKGAAALEATAATARLGESAAAAAAAALLLAIDDEPPPASALSLAVAVDEAAALEHILAGMRLARLCGEGWLLLNGSVHLHNLSAAALAALPPSGGSLPLELVDALRACVRHLRSLPAESLRSDLPSLQLVCALSTALARAQLALARAGGDPRPPQPDDEEEYAAAEGKEGGEEGGKGKPKAAAAKPAAAGKEAKGAGPASELAGAAEVLQWACALAEGQLHAKGEALKTLVSVQRAQGAKEPWEVPSTEAGAKALALLEALRLGVRDDAAALDAVLGALSLPDGAPLRLPELWAQLAERALAMARMPVVVRACGVCLSLLKQRQDVPGAPALAPSEWRPFAQAEWLHGAALGQLAGAKGQAAELSAQLRTQAAAHLATATEYSLHAHAPVHVARCASAFWAHALPLARDGATRAATATMTRAVLGTLRQAQLLDAAAG
ncbi:hypothetical protein T492DRAFT_916911, partial [Pavlovales sp. CCMP2436]